MLFDFFGGLLTEKQREYFDLYYNEDLSLSEIAENAGITRQGVRDFIHRGEDVLTRIEAKTGVIRKYSDTQKTVIRIEGCVQRLREISGDAEITALADSIAGELESLKV